MTHTTSTHAYRDEHQSYKATLIHPGTVRPPVVLVCHAWGGQTDYELDAARRLADMGFAGLAIDVYGEGRTGETTQECSALMSPLVEDRAELQSRLAAALKFAATLDNVSPGRMAAIGFCFGGLCALDMARMGADLRGVVSLHGLFTPPANLRGSRIRASVLALHGWEDPMATPDQAVEFAREMTGAGADWQLIAYGATMHAWTNPKADMPENGMLFNPVNRDRAFASAHTFLAEVLA